MFVLPSTTLRSQAATMVKAANVCEQQGFEQININVGCPAPICEWRLMWMYFHEQSILSSYGSCDCWCRQNSRSVHHPTSRVQSVTRRLRISPVLVFMIWTMINTCRHNLLMHTRRHRRTFNIATTVTVRICLTVNSVRTHIWSIRAAFMCYSSNHTITSIEQITNNLPCYSLFALYYRTSRTPNRQQSEHSNNSSNNKLGQTSIHYLMFPGGPFALLSTGKADSNLTSEC